MNPQATQQKEALDPQVVTLAKAIREVETRGQKDPYTAKGASGEFGAYQYTKGTWDGDVKTFLGKNIPLEQADRLTQNEVAYKKLKSLKDKGYNPGQIASIWNSGGPEWEGKTGVNSYGVKYDVPKYVNSVTSAYQAYKAGMGDEYTPLPSPSTVGQEEILSASQMQDMQSSDKYGAFSPAVTGEGPIKAGLKTAANFVPSAFNFAKNAVKALNPINIVKNVAAIPGEFKALAQETGGYGNALKGFGAELPGTAYEALVPEAGRQLIRGDTEGAQRSITNDPFGQIAPFVFAAKMATKGLDKTGITKTAETSFDSAVSKTAQPVIKGTSYAFGKAKAAAAAPIKYATSKVSGLGSETISEVARNPKAFTKEAMANTTRASLGEEVGTALKGRQTAVAETGAAYTPIRQSGAKVKVDPNYLEKTIQETTGLKVAKGKLQPTGASSIREARDVSALQQTYNLWKPEFKKGYLTADEFLNFRADLAKMAKYGRELTTSKPLADLSDIMRGKFNTTYRGQIPGLKKLDLDFAPLKRDLRRLGKDYLDPKTGELKDTAINKIANATGKGKDALLERLEEISPGITQKIKVLKAIEDIQNIHKVGTYTKAGIELGGLYTGLATGNIPLIAGSVVAMLFTNPASAVKMIRAYGNSKALAGEVLKQMGKVTGPINNLPETPIGEIVNTGAFTPRQKTLAQ